MINYIYRKYDNSELESSGSSYSKYKKIDLFWHYEDRGGYQLAGKTSWTTDHAGSNLGREGRTWNGVTPSDIGKGAVVTYSFPTWSEHSTNGYGDSGLSGLNALQQKFAKASLQAWADVANITFKELTGTDRQDADIKIGFYTARSSSDFNYGILPHTRDNSNKPIIDSWGNDTSGQVWLLRNGDNTHPVHNSYGAQVYTHEIGHALGLDHPASYNASDLVSPTYNRSAQYAEDTNQFSIMSYFSEVSANYNSDFKGYYASSPLMDDIAAIQYLYGKNSNAFSGDTTYGFNSNTGRDYLFASDNSAKLIFCAWDTNGVDTFDFSGYSANQRININQGAFSDVGGLSGNVSIMKGVNIENVIGGHGDDIIIGNSLDNIIKGGGGSDFIFGGGGSDILFGGAGSDTFAYSNVSESTFMKPDWIRDFISGEDFIDLTGISMDLKVVNHFTGRANEIVLKNEANTATLSLDHHGHDITDVHWQPDLFIKLTGQIDAADLIV
ncbi:serralysin family metalloprotease [Serratia marcescens]|uniref:serralysin family metalloprotease n=1 Tax=Serratia marcescens TaxID=615 RepID=UPI0038968BA3